MDNEAHGYRLVQSCRRTYASCNQSEMMLQNKKYADITTSIRRYRRPALSKARHAAMAAATLHACVGLMNGYTFRDAILSIYDYRHNTIGVS